MDRKESRYKLLYKLGYRHGPWKYARLDVKATSLSAAKTKVKKTHPKATTLIYQYELY